MMRDAIPMRLDLRQTRALPEPEECFPSQRDGLDHDSRARGSERHGEGVDAGLRAGRPNEVYKAGIPAKPPARNRKRPARKEVKPAA